MDLKSVINLRKKLENQESRLEMLKATAKTISLPRLDGLPKVQSATSRVEKFAVLISDAEQELENLRNEIHAASLDLLAEIFTRIKQSDVAAVLCLRYADCMTFAEISARLHYSERKIYSLHKRGIELFERG